MEIDSDNIEIYMPGDIISTEPGLMSGQNTYQEDGVIRSAVIGTMERTNKLIIVKSLRNAYMPQVGDIVVGRVVEILDKKWRVQIFANSECTLHLNSTYLNQQRQKTEEDELNMRTLFSENDVLCAEVHSINHDRSVNLHTRNIKYGRLINGQLVRVGHLLIKRQKHHFVRLKCGVDIILSHNGMIWLNNQDRSQRDSKAQNQEQEYTIQMRANMAKIANILKFLNNIEQEISVDLIDELMEVCKSQQISAVDILKNQHTQPLLNVLSEKNEKRKEEQLRKLEKNVNVLQQ